MLVIEYQGRCYEVKDDRTCKDGIAFLRAYPAPHLVPDTIITPTTDALRGAAYHLPLHYVWHEGRLYDVPPTEEVGLRAVYRPDGKPIGGKDAGVTFGFSKSYAQQGARQLTDRLDDEASLEAVREAIHDGDNGWNAYDEPYIWEAFNELFKRRFGTKASYEDDEIWVQDRPARVINVWEGKFRSLIIEADSLEPDLVEASPHHALWAWVVWSECNTLAGYEDDVMIYTYDGNPDTRPAKIYDYRPGSSWFHHKIDW